MIIGQDGYAPAQVTTSSPTAQIENICKLIVVASPTTLTDHFPRWARSPCVIPILFVDQLSIPKRWIRVVEKTTVYRSSAVSSAQALPTHTGISASQTPCGPVVQQARQPSGRDRMRPQPGRRIYLASSPAPAPSQFPPSMASLNTARPAQLYSSAVQQRRRPTPAYNVRYWPATCGNNHH